MRKITLFLLLAILIAPSCARRPKTVISAESSAIAIDSSLDAIQDTAYIASLAPIKEAVDREMNVKVAYVPDTMWVAPPECPLLNWLCDALLSSAREVCPFPVDIAIVNIGGVRGQWLPGDLTFGHIYQIMPFENVMVVITLTGQDILDLCASFAKYGAQGVAGMRVKIVDGHLADVTINGKPVDPNRKYNVATSDYLTGGADHMDQLKNYTDYWNSELLIRDLYIYQAKSQGTIRASVDGRMSIL